MNKAQIYTDKDTLTLYVKKDKAKKIIQSYNAFGWEIIEDKENNKYDDIADLTFTRPHIIKNKDELQLNQVYLDEQLNNIAKLEKHKHSQSTTLGLIQGLLSLMLLFLGIMICVKSQDIHRLLVGILIIILTAVLIFLQIVFLKTLIKNENQRFNKEYEKLNSELHELCKKAKLLLGEKDEQNKNN